MFCNQFDDTENSLVFKQLAIVMAKMLKQKHIFTLHLICFLLSGLYGSIFCVGETFLKYAMENMKWKFKFIQCKSDDIVVLIF